MSTTFTFWSKSYIISFIETFNKISFFKSSNEFLIKIFWFSKSLNSGLLSSSAASLSIALPIVSTWKILAFSYTIYYKECLSAFVSKI